MRYTTTSSHLIIRPFVGSCRLVDGLMQSVHQSMDQCLVALAVAESSLTLGLLLLGDGDDVGRDGIELEKHNH